MTSPPVASGKRFSWDMRCAGLGTFCITQICVCACPPLSLKDVMMKKSGAAVSDIIPTLFSGNTLHGLAWCLSLYLSFQHDRDILHGGFWRSSICNQRRVKCGSALGSDNEQPSKFTQSRLNQGIIIMPPCVDPDEFPYQESSCFVSLVLWIKVSLMKRKRSSGSFLSSETVGVTPCW